MVDLMNSEIPTLVYLAVVSLVVWGYTVRRQS